MSDNAAGDEPAKDIYTQPNAKPQPLGKSHLKMVEELKAAAAPVPIIPAGQGPSPFDPALLRIDPRNSTVQVKREIINISIRKPSRFEPFRAHPTLRIDTTVCMPKKGAHEGETYLVAPNMRSILFQHISFASLLFLMTAEGAPLIAPIRIPGDGEKEHTAHSSFRQIAVCAEKEWVLAIYNKATGSYEKGTGADFDPPVWPDLTLDQILEKAFRDYHIKDTAHPVVKSLGLFTKPSYEA